MYSYKANTHHNTLRSSNNLRCFEIHHARVANVALIASATPPMMPQIEMLEHTTRRLSAPLCFHIRIHSDPFRYLCYYFFVSLRNSTIQRTYYIKWVYVVANWYPCSTVIPSASDADTLAFRIDVDTIDTCWSRSRTLLFDASFHGMFSLTAVGNRMCNNHNIAIQIWL